MANPELAKISFYEDLRQEFVFVSHSLYMQSRLLQSTLFCGAYLSLICTAT